MLLFLDMIPVPNVSLKAHQVSPKRPVTEKARPSTTDQATTAAITSTDKPSWYSIDKHSDKDVDGDYAKTGTIAINYYPLMRQSQQKSSAFLVS